MYVCVCVHTHTSQLLCKTPQKSDWKIDTRVKYTKIWIMISFPLSNIIKDHIFSIELNKFPELFRK